MKSTRNAKSAANAVSISRDPRQSKEGLPALSSSAQPWNSLPPRVASRDSLIKRPSHPRSVTPPPHSPCHALLARPVIGSLHLAPVSPCDPWSAFSEPNLRTWRGASFSIVIHKITSGNGTRCSCSILSVKLDPSRPKRSLGLW
jgi:hypothetical protein